MSKLDDEPSRSELAAEAFDDQCRDDPDYLFLCRIAEYIEEHQIATLDDLAASIDADKQEIRELIAENESEQRNPMKHYGLREKDFH